ncbi:MAG: hypothetical protein ACK5MS_18755, partial [Planctomyces sp.]
GSAVNEVAGMGSTLPNFHLIHKTPTASKQNNKVNTKNSSSKYPYTPAIHLRELCAWIYTAYERHQMMPYKMLS